MKQVLIFFSIFLLASSCARGATSRAEHKEGDTIEMPEIPSNLRQPAERADYLITHYWDNLDMNDTLQSHDRPLLEQSFVNFLSILPYASSEDIVKNGFSILLEKTSADSYVYKGIIDMTNQYLFEPDSPMYNEDIYLIYLNAWKDSKTVNETEKIRIEDRIDMVSKNRKGSPATDFSFKMPNGAVSTLYETLEPGKDLMLIFFDPDCENCEETMNFIQSNLEITNDIRAGRIKILAVYSGDNESAWRRKAATLPSSWTVGINVSEIEDQELYYLPAMPTIYLIGSDGKVKGKDIMIR